MAKEYSDDLARCADMITVKIELWPLGKESRAREIGRMYIANDGARSMNDPAKGDYLVAVCRRGTTDVPREIYGGDEAGPDFAECPKATRAGTVQDYPRLAYNVWRLITRALLATFPEERTPKGIKTSLSERVMTGLRWFRDYTTGDNPNREHYDTVRAECDEAEAWLDAALEDLATAKREELAP